VDEYGSALTPRQRQAAAVLDRIHALDTDLSRLQAQRLRAYAEFEHLSTSRTSAVALELTQYEQSSAPASPSPKT